MASFDASRYHAADYARREAGELWPRVWLLAAHDSELTRPGAYRCIDVGAESLLVIHGADGAIRAFHNACRHRGMPLAAAGRGQLTELRCAYHRWRYGLDGALLDAPPGTRLHEASRELQPGDLALAEVRCERALGFVWVNMHAGAAPLAEYLAPVLAELDAYQLGSWTLSQELSAELACNWKTSVDAHNEGYHVPSLHPETLPLLDASAAEFRALDRHSCLTVPFAVTAPKSDARVLHAWAQSQGAELTGVPAEPAAIRAALQRSVAARLAGRGAPALEASRCVDTWQYHLFPNVQLNLRAEELLLFRHWPHREDPGRMRFEQLSFQRSAASGEPALPRRLDPASAGFGPVTDADVAVVQRQQRGLASRGLGQLALTSQEPAIAHMHAVLDRYLP